MSDVDIGSALQFICALLLIIALAYAIGRFLKGNLMIVKKSGRITLSERIVLDAKNALYVVEIDNKTLLLSSGEKGVTLLKELRDYHSGEGEDDTANVELST